MACQVQADKIDDDYSYIMFEIAMNYPIESIRENYWKNKEKQKDEVTAAELRELGYSEEDIQRM